jgi:alkanesulfonate monooxygenase SsuD/methylene tetrahydromethanopterin reductase-like flavin-dependent oxidoreductase (luciferase family)
MAPIRFGFGFDMRNPKQWAKPWTDFYAEHLEFIAWTETLGFGQVWFAEHHGIEDGYLPSPLIMGTAVAARTKSIRIGQGIALAPFYHPVRLAEDSAVLDIISQGRLELSLGTGYLQFEADAYGFDLKRRGKLADELLSCLIPLWEGETVTMRGEFFDIQQARIFPLPVQQPHIPLFVGGTARPGFRRAARYADGFNGPVEYHAAYVEEVIAAGRDPAKMRFQSLSYSDMWLVVSEDPEKTIHEVAPHAYYQINTYAEWQKDETWAPFTAMGLEGFKQSGMMRIMTPDECIAYIKSRREIAPFEAFCMQAPTGFPLAKYAEHVELFAKKVLPAFQ